MVSVVIITYKRPMEILFRALNSVLKQTYTNFELIVVNDAPEEIKLASEIKKRIEELNDSRIRYIQHRINLGANSARNTGLNASKGEFIAFLDDDDEWLEKKLEVQLQKFQENPKLGLVYCGFKIVSANSIYYKHPRITKNAVKDLVEANFIGSTSFPLILTSALRDVGGFDVKQKSCQEYELWIRLSQKYDIGAAEDILGIYYTSDDSTFQKNYKSYIDGDISLITKHQNIFNKYPLQYSNHLLNMAIYLLKAGQFKHGIKYKIKSFVVCPYNPNNITIVFVARKLLNMKCNR